MQGPRANSCNQMAEWTGLQINHPEGPFHGWDHDLVLTSLKSHACCAATASSLHAYPLPRLDMRRGSSNASLYQSCAVVWSMPSSARGRVVLPKYLWRGCRACAWPGIIYPRMKTQPPFPSHGDMFRSELSCKTKPMMFDDGPTDEVKPSDVKTFLNVAKAVAVIWTAWGDVKLLQNGWQCIVMKF